MRTGSLFSGYAGLDMAVNAYFGSETAWFVEYDAAPSKILAHHWPDVPNHGDITRIDWGTVEPVDILTGGFPCQDVSAAGRRAGIREGTRSGLWSHFAEAVNQLQPRWVVIENVRGLLSATADRPMEPEPDAVGDRRTGPVLRALGAVLGDLCDIGYDAQWKTVAASDVGACHRRERVFIVAAPADAERGGRDGRSCNTIGRPGRRTTLAGSGESGSGGEAVAARRHVADGNGSLPEVLGVHLLPTPNASDGTGGGQHPDKREGHSRQLIDYVLLFTGREPGDTLRELPSQAALARGSAVSDSENHRVDWGPYEAAIRRQERVTGRPAPNPTEPNRRGKPRLSAEFASWMMMLPDGHVTGVGLSRNEELKAIGNGVVPAQAFAALRILTPIAENLGVA